jgi:carbon-monoxide dehydrogenase medium subunit
VDEALKILAEHSGDVKVLAGGQSLIPVMNFRLASPDLLIDLNPIKELSYIRKKGDNLLIGAMTRQRAVERDPLVAEHAPLLHETMPFIAHPQIRNRGTIGGSLVHADPAAELPVVMLALGASFVIRSQNGERAVTAADFFQGLFTVDLQPGEILTEVIVPVKKPNTGYAFLEMARRHGDFAMMGLAATVGIKKGVCQSASLVYLNAGDRPMSAPSAAAMLVGQPPDEVLFTAAAEKAAAEEIEPMGNLHSSAEFQRHLAKVLTVRALKTAAARATGSNA